MTDVSQKDTEPKGKVEEQRVKPTVIRRRAATPARQAPCAPEETVEVKTSVSEAAERIAGAAETEQIQTTEVEKAQEAAGEIKSTTPRIGPVKIEITKPQQEGEKPQTLPRVGVVGHIDQIAPSVKDDWKDIAKKAVRKRKSRTELETEDIKKAGGVQRFATEVISSPNERVFEPTRRRKAQKREFLKTKITTPKAIKKIIRIEDKIGLIELSKTMGVKATELTSKAQELGMEIADANPMIEVDMASLLADAYGYKVEKSGFKEEDFLTEPDATASAHAILRPPVVTVMGHVDHGKTSILDYIRKTQVAAKEAGGITQHIGAYEVIHNGKKISFLDTPGHEAFTRMRARGANATDIVVLVVAADDGVMPQTVEAINHAKAAEVPIVVAINKSDLPGANMDKVKKSLAEKGLVPEDWGGEAICVPTSAKTGKGIPELLDMILLQAEVMDLKSDPAIRPKGMVLEGRLDRGRGPVATILVQEGTLKKGQFIVCGLHSGKVRAMSDALGKQVSEAPPSKPVEIVGLEGVPEAGDEFVGVTDEKTSKLITEQRRQKLRAEMVASPAKMTLEDLAVLERKELGVVIKGDVMGSVEAINDSLEKIASEKVKLKIIHRAVGGITESDVMLAYTSGAIIIGFNVSGDRTVQDMAKQKGVEIRTYRIIYELLDDVKKAMIGVLEPTRTEQAIGSAEVREIFKISKAGMIAGCMVKSGKVTRQSKVRLLRDNKIIYEGKLASLRRFKDDVREVTEGQDCGMSFDKFQDVKAGDVIQAYLVQETEAEL